LFKSPAKLTQKARHGTTIHEQEQGTMKNPDLTTLTSEVGGGTNIHSK